MLHIPKMLLFLAINAIALKDPILNLDLSLTIANKMITTFSIGSSEVNGSILDKFSLH